MGGEEDNLPDSLLTLVLLRMSFWGPQPCSTLGKLDMALALDGWPAKGSLIDLTSAFGTSIALLKWSFQWKIKFADIPCMKPP